MIGIYDLLLDLKKTLEGGFEKYYFKAPDKRQFAIPSVWIGSEPPKKSLPESAGVGDSGQGNPPFVVLRSLDGEVKIDGDKARVHEVKIGIMCAIYTDENYSFEGVGYRDIMSMVERVLIILNEIYCLGDNKWKLQDSFQWTSGIQKEANIYDPGYQSHPFYGATLIVTFISYVEKPSLWELGASSDIYTS